jgi:hypothetical protein
VWISGSQALEQRVNPTLEELLRIYDVSEEELFIEDEEPASLKRVK